MQAEERRTGISSAIFLSKSQLFYQPTCLCPIEIGFRQAYTQLIQFTRQHGVYLQVISKLSVVKPLNVITTTFYQCGKVSCF